MILRKQTALTKTTLVIAAFLSVLVLGSCKKEVTQVVDQGHSAVYKIHAADFTTIDAGKSYGTTLNVPEVDQQIVDNGGVSVYLSLNGGDTYEALPEVIAGYSYGALHAVGTVSIDLTHPNGGSNTIPAPVDPPIGYFLVKVVILDATALPN